MCMDAAVSVLFVSVRPCCAIASLRRAQCAASTSSPAWPSLCDVLACVGCKADEAAQLLTQPYEAVYCLAASLCVLKVNSEMQL